MKLPDATDTTAWRVYADRLTAVEDPRGALLLLELDGPENAYRRALNTWWDITPLNDATELILDYLIENRQGFIQFRELTGTRLDVENWSTAQLLCTIDNDSGSPVLRALYDEVVRKGLEIIETAFDGVPPPEEPFRTLRQAEAWDFYRIIGRETDVLGRWQDIPDQEFLECQDALNFLEAPGLHHYLPAAMCFSLRAMHSELARHNCFHTLHFTLEPNETEQLRAHQRERFHLFRFEQVVAIAAFCALTEDIDTRGWYRAAIAGRNAVWLDVFQEPVY